MINLSSETKGLIVIDETIRAFAFLHEECNYCLPIVRQRYEGTSNDYTSIRYQSSSMFFEIVYSHMEAEFSIQIGLLRLIHDFEEYRQGFGLDEIILFSDKDAILPSHPRLEIDIRSEIDKLASIVKIDLHEILCNAGIILEWMKLRKIKYETEQIEDHLKARRKEAKEAWENKDYQKVVSIYQRISDHLQILEKKRFSFAIKRLQKCSNDST